VICPLRISASSVLHFIPGADGFRACITYHEPMRARVAWRVSALFSILQRGQGESFFSQIAPQNGQTDMTGADDLLCSAVRSASSGIASKDLVISLPMAARLLVGVRLTKTKGIVYHCLWPRQKN
jgi:hypothetical protein